MNRYDPSDNSNTFYLECDVPDCDNLPHWTVYDRKYGAGITEYATEASARKESERLNALSYEEYCKVV